jgi:cobalt-zinc-cadmium efflux system outer membrane protein
MLAVILTMAVTAEPVRAQPAAMPPLTLADAFARALESHPSLQAAAEAQQAAAAGMRQAGRFLNPTLDLSIEHAAGSGPYRAVDRAETTLALRQPIELGGDRGARRDLAARELDAADYGGYIRRLDLLRDVELAFVDAHAAVATLIVAEQRLEVARELALAVDRRVRAARDPLMARSRAQASLAAARSEAETNRLAAAAARARLASYWAGSADFQIEAATLERMAAEPGKSATPDVAQLEIERERADAGIALEQARAVPDVTVSAGVRQYQEDDAAAAVVGLSVPLPIWDRNTDAIARARADRARAGHEVEARKLAIGREKADLAAQIEAARLQVEALQSNVIPLSVEALGRAREGYAGGAFSYLDVFDAQRALSDAQLRRVAALQSFHRAQALLSRLSGAHAEFQPANSQPGGEATR